MRRSSSARIASLAFFLVTSWLGGAGTGLARPAGAYDLQLEVVINETSTGLIGRFHRRADGRLAIAPEELQELGLKPDRQAAADDGLLDLDRLPGVTYRMDAATQVIRFDTGDSRRLPRIYDVRKPGRAPDPAVVASGYGAVLNYLVFAASDTNPARFWDVGRNPAVAASLDARAFAPLGVLSQTAIVGTRPSPEWLRLDTTWTYSDPGSAITYRAGDVISGGLPWTRPVRLGGAEVQRNFALRPDLVTAPMPSLSGSAAVPSTVDVYINNVQTFARDLPAGPFEIRNLPIVSGPGTQRIVVRDSLGRETVTDQAFYASAKLLREGLSDFSVEAGYPRLFYGVRSNDYDSNLVVSASARRGVTDWLTIEGHAEGGGTLWNGGAGLVVPVGNFGVASLAAAGSTNSGDTGTQIAASFEAGVGSAIFYARTQRTFGTYADIAATAGRALLSAPSAHPISYRPPIALDQVALSFPLGFDPARLTLSYTDLREDSGAQYQIFGASYSRPIFRHASLYATAFTDFGDRKNSGFLVGLSVSFADAVSASASVTKGPAGTAGGIDVVKAQPLETGSYGWRVRDSEGAAPDRAASASYRASFARLQGGVEQIGNTTRASAEVEGATVLAAGNLFLTNRIDDAFAVVDAGAPGVKVFYENRPIGETDARGLLLVPTLNAYQPNRLSIDPKKLPVDADIASTRETVVPADRSAAVVKFGINTAAQSALVSFRGKNGSFLPAGARGRLEATGEPFVIGYDGEAYLRGLQAENSVVIETANSDACRARFAFAPRPGTQVRIEGVPCH